MPQPLSRRQFLGAAAAVPLMGTLASAAPAGKTLLLIAGSPSHGPGDHEFNAGVRLLETCLREVPNLTVRVALSGFPKDRSVFDGIDGILCFADGGAGHPFLRGDNLQFIGTKMTAGVGLMCAHYAVEVPKDVGAKEFRDWIGGCYEHQYSCNPFWSPEYKEFPEHPITRGVKPFSIRDEWYMTMRFREKMQGITPILTATPSEAVRNGPYVYPKGPYPHIQANKGQAEHMMWATERADGGRGVGFTGGHVHRNWLEPNFRKVVLNALVWICKMDVPAEGIASTVTEDLIKMNMDPKGKK
ncbi:MAG: ThuA domain-containing protein [Gemmataceae bacterium]